MISRRSSGSMRAESAVEPTKSENITVTWRRSAVSCGVIKGSVAEGGGAVAFFDADYFSHSQQQLTPMTERSNAKFFQVLVSQMG